VSNLLDPYVRSADALSESEKRILVAAFVASNVFSMSIGRVVPVTVGRPVLISKNDRSDVLIVAFQPNSPPATARGRIGKDARIFPGSSVEATFDTIRPPFQQILLPKEQLWFVADVVSAGVTGFVVSEVTP